MDIRAVVFDWGGTLTPWHDIDLVSQWYAYAEIYDPENARALAHRLADAEVRRWQVQRDSGGSRTAGALDQIFLDEGIDIGGARHLRALGSYLDFWAPHTCADPDARPLLESLRAEGLLIGVLSNTLWPSSHHREVFERDELADLIDAACYTSEMPVAKPHAEAFTTAVEVLGVPISTAVFVGDRLWDDIAGAAAVGMRTIWVPHSRVPAEEVPDASARPDATVDRLADVAAIIRAWRSGTGSEPSPGD